MKELSRTETRRAMRELGIERAVGKAFGIYDGAKGVRYAFHRHVRHQFLFPVSGVLFVETKQECFACSPELGLWIPAGVLHATTTGQCEAVSLFFEAKIYAGLGRRAGMVRITPLLREAAREAAKRRGYEQALFAVLHAGIAENREEGVWPSLPVGRMESVRKAMAVAMGNLGTVTVPELAKLSGLSERTMRRRFRNDLGMGPEMFLQRARLMRAMQLLVGEREKSITEIALEVGYSNHSAFTVAFRKLAGKTPREFRSGG